MEIPRSTEGQPEDAAVVQFAVATEELLRAGLAMAKREHPARYTTAMALLDAGTMRMQLTVDFADPVRIVLRGVAPGGDELARMFSFDVGLVTPNIN